MGPMRILIVFLIVLLLGCTTPSTLLVNRDGKVVRCAATRYGYGLAGAIAIGAAQSAHSGCVTDARRLGFAEIPDASVGVESQFQKTPLTVAVVRRNTPA